MSDTIELAIAGGLMLLTALVALRAGSVRPSTERREPAPAPGATPAAAPSDPVAAPVSGPTSTRPRILTGEPAAPEPRKPASRRAFKLVGGIALLAAAGAFGLLAAVRALISMFDQIGG